MEDLYQIKCALIYTKLPKVQDYTSKDFRIQWMQLQKKRRNITFKLDRGEHTWKRFCTCISPPRIDEIKEVLLSIQSVEKIPQNKSFNHTKERVDNPKWKFNLVSIKKIPV